MLAIAAIAVAGSSSPQPVTFGTGKSAFELSDAEITVFEHNTTQPAAMTHFWMTGAPAAGPNGTDSAIVRYYVDGEKTPSIEFLPPMAAGVGFGDATPNWGTAKIGRGSNLGGWFVNIRVPFSLNVRVTLAMPTGARGTAFVILRGCEECGPIRVGEFTLPPTARLRLHKLEAQPFAPLEFVPLVNLPTGDGVIYMHAIAASSASFNFWEGCYRMHTPHDAPWPGLVLSTGMEDYFDSAFGFNAGAFRLPSSGCTHRTLGEERVVSAQDGENVRTRPLNVSAYRFHEEDPLFFHNGVRYSWRNGDYINAKAHPDSPKCYIDQPGPGDKPVGVVLTTTVTAYTWVYTW